MQTMTSRSPRGSTDRTRDGVCPVAGRLVADLERVRLTVPFVGRVKLPPAPDLAFYTTVGALAVAGLLEWPVAAVVVGGHLLASVRSRSLREVGEALEEA
ncbi:hypothetical protein ABT297_12190 [Dactylosporangium sp. NPDC000555]|uniref:hypothetical protein n=1 Tax=Dactylosporangium sp. NPDC000555 TaxID=3154260 RepID=UPI003326B7A9